MKLRLSLALIALSFTPLALAQEVASDTAVAEAVPAETAPAPTPTPADPLAAAKAALAEVVALKGGDAQAGAAKAAVCGACHGMDGNSADPQYPKLAGQHEAYVARQLALFKTNTRQNPIMLGFSVGLSAQDMLDIGAHFAAQKVQPGVADEAVVSDEFSANKGQRLVDVGEKLYRGGDAARGIPACIACHGPAGRGVPGPSYPALGGQHAGYTATMLKLFKATPAGAPLLRDPSYTVMAEVAARLGDEDIAALSTYLQGLHEAVATP